MRVGPDAVIPADKLTRYLLVPRPRDDKSRFLAQAGFAQHNAMLLRAALLEIAATAEATIDGVSAYGTLPRADGELRGPNGVVLRVTTIWLRWREEQPARFITLSRSESRGHDATPLLLRRTPA